MITDNEIINHLLTHLEVNDYSGYDPSSVRFSHRLNKLNTFLDRFPRSFNYYLKAILSRLTLYGGHRLLIFINPQKVFLPKCLALASIAHINYSHAYDLTEHIFKAEFLLQRLLKISLPEKKVWSHGYPYKIKDVAVEIDTPNLVTTYFVAEAFWYYLKYYDFKYISIYNQIVNNCLSTFPAKPFKNYICFMYTPESTYFVHNANLMMLEMLSKNAALQKVDIPSIAERALLFSLTDFESTGAFPYAGGQDPNLSEDNYHTGYVLRSLMEIMITGIFPKYRDRIDACISNGIHRYLKYFVKDGYIVRDKNFTINSHSLAEAILIHKKFKAYMNNSQISQLKEAIINTKEFLWTKSNKFFANASYPIIHGKLYVTDLTDMLRWSQAWMARSLSEIES
jgi:hypothetical protein